MRSEPEPTGYWSSYDDFPVEDWQYEVANGDTRLGYHAWRRHQQDQIDGPHETG